MFSSNAYRSLITYLWTWQAFPSAAPFDGVDQSGHRSRRTSEESVGGQRRRETDGQAAAPGTGLWAETTEVNITHRPVHVFGVSVSMHCEGTFFILTDCCCLTPCSGLSSARTDYVLWQRCAFRPRTKDLFCSITITDSQPECASLTFS